MQQKIQRSIDDQLTSPINNTQLFMAYAFGGIIRASIIASIIMATSYVMIKELPLVHPFLFILSLAFIGFFFAMLGVFVGLRSEKFDDLSLYQTFILQPLIFLGGIFYSVSLLPHLFATLTKFNPIYYMINMVRYSMLGKADIHMTTALLVVGLAGLVLFYVNYSLFNSGYKLRS